jgi:multidrug resistance efflux pump
VLTSSFSNLLGRVVTKPLQAVIGIGGGLTLGLLGWSVLGSLPSEVTGTGMLVRGNRMIAVQAKLGGTVTAANAKVNNTVSPAQVIMSLDTSQQTIELVGAERQLKAGIPLAKNSETAGDDAEATALAAVRLAEHRLQEEAPALRRKQGQLKSMMAEANALYQRRLISINDLTGVAQDLAQVNGQLSGLEDALNAQEIAYKQIRQQNAGNRYQMAQQNIGTYANAAGIRQSIVQAGQIKSPVSGQLISIGKQVGDYVNPGDVMFTVMPQQGRLRAIVLVSSNSVKRVKPGDAVLISPTESPATRFGYIKGTVSGVGNAPATQDELLRAFGTTEATQSFTNSFSQQPGVDLPYIVLVDIRQDSKGQPLWTLGRQPPWGFRPGGVANARIITDTVRPIQLLIPSLRKL